MTAALVAPAPLLSGGAASDRGLPEAGALPEIAPAVVPSADQEPLAYTSAPGSAATYRVADSMRLAMMSPRGPMDLTNIGRATLTVSFEADPAGFRATAEVTDFNGSAHSSQMGTRTIGSDAVGGAVVAVVGPAGLVELVDKPDLSPEMGQYTLFEALGHDLFPRLPERAVAAGESWTDTVTWSSTAGGGRSSSTRIRTFTLGEQVVVDGRSLQTIVLSATVEYSSGMGQGQTRYEGTQTGNYFWDAEAGLLRSAELVSEFKGEAKVGRAPPTTVTVNALQRIWREN